MQSHRGAHGSLQKKEQNARNRIIKLFININKYSHFLKNFSKEFEKIGKSFIWSLKLFILQQCVNFRIF